MDHEKYLTTLLERRDASPPVPETDPVIEADLQRLNKVRDDLRNISEVHPPPYVWQNINANLDNRQSHSFFQSSRWPLAMAASIFLAALLLIQGYQVPEYAPQLAETNINKLIAQSQLLERRMQNTNRGYFVNTGTRGALLQRISDVDARLSRLAYANAAYSPELKQLWQQRVNLMRSMIAMEQTQTGNAETYTL